MKKIEQILEDFSADDFEIHDKLNPKFFKGESLKKSIKNGLLKIADLFIEFCKIKPSDVEDVLITGSNTNYNYSDYSDMDIHIVVDFSKILPENRELLRDYFDDKKVLFAEKYDLKAKEIPVELYIQDSNEQHVSTGVYSLYKDDWVVKPVKDTVVIDTKKVDKKAEEVMKEIDALAKSSFDVDKVNAIKEKIKKMRKAGLDKKGEYSIENLAFKVLRNNGYLEKLSELKIDAVNKEYSVNETALKEYMMKKAKEKINKRLRRNENT